MSMYLPVADGVLFCCLSVSGGSAQGQRHQGVHGEFAAEARWGHLQVSEVLQHQAREGASLQVCVSTAVVHQEEEDGGGDFYISS